MKRAKESLRDLARVYFLTEVAGQARATLEAKQRDLTRTQMFLILQRVAAQANAHIPAGERIKVSPHVLRHGLWVTHPGPFPFPLSFSRVGKLAEDDLAEA